MEHKYNISIEGKHKNIINQVDKTKEPIFRN